MQNRLPRWFRSTTGAHPPRVHGTAPAALAAPRQRRHPNCHRWCEIAVAAKAPVSSSLIRSDRECRPIDPPPFPPQRRAAPEQKAALAVEAVEAVEAAPQHGAVEAAAPRKRAAEAVAEVSRRAAARARAVPIWWHRRRR